MKTKIYSLIILGCILSLYACKKDNNDNSNGIVAKLLSNSYYENGVLKMKQTYEYNSSGKPVKVISNDGSYVTFSYGTNNVVVKDYDSSGLVNNTDTYTLNAKGLATSEVSNWSKKSGKSGLNLKPKHSPKGTSTTFFEYDANNYKIREIYTETTTTDTTIYTIANGNTVTTLFGGSYVYTRTNQYLMEKTNTMGLENIGVSFMGKQDINLISTTIYDFFPGTTTYNYTYEFDAKDRVIKMWENATPLIYSTYSYSN